MKKIIVFLWMLAGVLSLQAQEKYKIEFGCIKGKTKPMLSYWYSCQISVTINFQDGSTYYYDWHLNATYSNPPAYSTSKKVRGVIVRFLSYRTDSYEGYKSYTNSDLHGNVGRSCNHIEDQIFQTNAGNFDDYFFFRVIPTHWSLTSSSNEITDCHSIYLDADGDRSDTYYYYSFYSAQFIWQYSIGNNGAWKTFSYGDDYIPISGSMIPNFSSHVGHDNVKVRYIYECNGDSSDIITFSPKICAPELVSAEPIAGCGSGSSGKIQLTYSRALYPDETLNFVVYDENLSDPQGLYFGWENDPNVDINQDQRMVTLSGLEPGTYNVRLIGFLGGDSLNTYSDKTGTYSKGGVVIGTANTAEFVKVESTPVKCPGSNDGTVTVTASGGSGSYYFKLYNYDEELVATSAVFQVSGTVSGLPEDSYNVHLYDSGGCESGTVKVAMVDGPGEFEIDKIEMRQSTYNEDGGEAGNGYIEVSIFPYGKSYRFTWRSGSKTGSVLLDETAIETSRLGNISSGTYYVQVTNESGCSIDSLIVLSASPQMFVSITQTGAIACSGDTTGQLTASVTGGTPPYRYRWYQIDEYTQNETLIPGANTAILSSITAGLYRVQVEDADGRFKDATGTVKGTNPLNVEAQITYPSCYDMNNGSIKLSVSGGNTPYSYKWSNGSEQSEITNLARGSYSVTVTDSKNCEVAQKSFSIDKPERLTAELYNYKPISRPDANDGGFSVLVKGGTKPYSINCVKDGQQNIAATSSVPQVDGSYLFTYMNLAPRNYEITVRDNNFNPSLDYQACSANLSVNLSNLLALGASITEIKSIACFDGDGTLEAAGIGGDAPYTYKWFRVVNNNQIFLSVTAATVYNLKSGTYIVEVTDNSGYTAFSPEFYLAQPNVLSLNFNVKNNLCSRENEGQVTVNVQGGVAPYSYLWDSGETTATISGKPNGPYAVTVTDRNGCQAAGNASINSSSSFQVESELTPMSCYGLNNASIKLKITGGTTPYSFLWSNNSTGAVLSNIGAGSYKVIISDANNCAFDTTFVIPELLPIQAKISEMKTPFGYGYSNGIFTVDITGGNPPYNAYWTNEQGIIMDSVSIENGNNKAITKLKGISEGNYYLYIEDNNYQKVKEDGLEPSGCAATFMFYMPQPPKLEVNISELKSITCFGSADGGITSSVTGGVPFNTGLPYTYEWIFNNTVYQNNTNQISGLAAGTYQLKVADANGIEALSEPFVLGQPDALALQFQTADIKCSRDETGWVEVTVSGGTPPYTYEWSTGDTSPRIEDIPKGKYMCWVKDVNGCEVTGFASIVQTNAIIVQAELIEPACRGGDDGKIILKLSGGEPPYTYEWENGEKTLTRTGLAKGSYTFTVTDFYGCGYEVNTYELGEPDEITVDLGGDRELCIGQDVTVEAKIPEPAKSFTWYNEAGKEFFTGSKYTLSQAGTYTVKAVTAKGCTVYGNITITRDNREIVSDFLVASKVPVNDDVHVINVSVPEPDKVEWILPENTNLEVIEESNQLLTVIFHEYGDYIIGMKSFSGKCWEIAYKTVRVMDKIDIDNYEDADEPMLRSFTVMPNPALDHFTAVIELKEDAPVELSLVDSGTGVIMQRKHLRGRAVYKEVFNLLPTEKGIYVLKLASPKAKAGLKVILK